MICVRKLWRRVVLVSFLFVVPHAVMSQQLAITMDDLDLNAADVPRMSLEQRGDAILRALKESGVRAAIFVCGMRVDTPQGVEHVREWGRAGHLVGNHTYSHQLLGRMNAEDFIQDIRRNDALLTRMPGYSRILRFPALKEGNTLGQRDAVRAYIHAAGYRMGYVTIDTSDWAIDQRLRDGLRKDPSADLAPYREFYLAHLWERAQFYDRLAIDVLGRSPKHTLLIHHNLLNALFLPDVIRMFRSKGWKIINATNAFSDEVFKREPGNVPAGESIIWAIAKETGRFDDRLRYPGEDEIYERAAMNERGL